MAVQKLIGQTILSFRTLASTNDKLRSLINDGDLPNGTVVDCGQQMDGRGQRGNVWLSEANQNIHLSILFQPNDLFVQKQFLISKAVALGIRSTINEVLQFSDAIIKWPNDILIAGDKVAGVLIENIIQGNKIGQSIIKHFVKFIICRTHTNSFYILLYYLLNIFVYYLLIFFYIFLIFFYIFI